MDRRVGGGLLLVVALLAVLTVPRVLNPVTVAGRASVEPPSPAAVVGDCTLGPGGTTSDALGSDGTTVVPCTDPHHGQVYRVVEGPVDAGDPDRCWSQVESDVEALLGPPVVAGWQPSLDWQFGTLVPDARQAAAGQRWMACLVMPRDETAQPVGSLAGIYPTGAAPGAWGTCLTRDRSGETAPDQWNVDLVSCALPHDGELIALRPELDGDVTQAALDEDCAELTAHDSGRPDLPAESGLLIATRVLGGRDGATVTLTEPFGDLTDTVAACVIETTDGRQLTSSLRLLGGAPLPWKA